jgi:hypothetical protein
MLERFGEVYDAIAACAAKGDFDTSTDASLRIPSRECLPMISTVLKILVPVKQVSVWSQGDKYGTLQHVLPAVAWLLKRLRQTRDDEFEYDFLGQACHELLSRSILRRFAKFATLDNPAMLASLVQPAYFPTLLSCLGTENVGTPLSVMADWLAFLTFKPATKRVKLAPAVALAAFRGTAVADQSEERERDEDEQYGEQLRRCEEVVASLLFTLNGKDSLTSESMVRHGEDYHPEELLDALVSQDLPFEPDAATTRDLDAKMATFYADYSNDDSGEHGGTQILMLVRVLLCGAATSAEAERAFSASGRIDSPLRGSLQPERLEMMTVIQCYLKRLKSREDIDTFEHAMYKLLMDSLCK